MMAPTVTVYMRVRRHWVSVRVLPHQGEAAQAEGVARVAARRNRIWGLPYVIACGNEVSHIAEQKAGEREVGIYDAFCHPRALITGFFAEEVVVDGYLRRACGGWRLRRFRMVIHLLDEIEGGLTDVEERAFQELGRRLGGRRVLVHQGPTELSDEQAVALASRQ